MSELVVPHNDEAERSVLGATLLPGDVLTDLLAAEGLRADHFYRPRHERIFRAAAGLHDRGEPVDPVTVCAELERGGGLEEVGGREYVHQLPVIAPAPGSYRRHAQLVIEDARYRRMVEAGHRIACGAAARDRGEVADGRGDLEASYDRGQRRLTVEDRQRRLWEHIERGEVETFPLPFRGLSEMLYGGLRRKQLTVVGGWRSHTKSVLLSQILELGHARGSKVALYLNEDSVDEHDLRWMARQTGIPFKLLMQAKLRDDAERGRYLKALERLPYDVVEAHGWTAQDVDYDVRAQGWDLVGLDLLNGLPAKDTAEIDENVKLLRMTCGRADCHLVATQHLNRLRDVGHYPPPPTLRDIRGSGAIADFATNVLFVYRREEEDGQGKGTGRPGDDVLVTLAKAKNGIPDEMHVRFDGNRMRLLPQAEPGTVGIAA